MPKGRGSNKRRSKHQKDRDLSGGYNKLIALFERALKVQAKRRKNALARHSDD